ncbi:MAG TPA: homoserine dehydrogenase [Firmicutes bacterium]|nr:homoserine dehydrogenase [Bacillota bacterium]
MDMKKIRVGMLGLGTVGGGTAALLQQNRTTLEEKIDAQIVLEKVLVRDPSRPRSVDLPADCLTTDPAEILDDPGIDIIIELIGGIEPARRYIFRALRNGKYVVTANKDLMAAHGTELLAVAREYNRNIFYEGSVGGGIPLIRPLQYSLAVDRIHRIVGIVNGTTNYILTRMSQDGMSLQEALVEAQEKGFAEADPGSDLEGLDAAYKLVIMAVLAFGKQITPDRVHVEGISAIKQQDIEYARELGCAVKLLAIGEQYPAGLALRVHPTLVPLDHPLASVLKEYNAVFIEGQAVGEVMFYGRGAGSLPTACSVLADIVEAARCLLYGITDGVIESKIGSTAFVPVEELRARFYLRFLAEDRSGVFASLANVFGDEKVSLDMVIQKRRVGSLAEIVLVTHDVREGSFHRALAKVLNIPAVRSDHSMIRLLG